MKLKPLKHKELIAKLKKLGLEGPISGGKHPYFLFGKTKMVIPNPHRSEVGKDIIKSILNKIGLEFEEFLKL